VRVATHHGVGLPVGGRQEEEPSIRSQAEGAMCVAAHHGVGPEGGMQRSQAAPVRSQGSPNLLGSPALQGWLSHTLSTPTAAPHRSIRGIVKHLDLMSDEVCRHALSACCCVAVALWQ